MDNVLFEEFLIKWHDIIENKDPEKLEELLAEGVVFYSPVVFTPQKGKFLTKMYLMGASNVLHNDFKYKRKIIQGRSGMLEFECTIDDITVEGVDIITLDEFGKVDSFKVLIRPLKAIQKVHEKMGEILQLMNPSK